MVGFARWTECNTRIDLSVSYDLDNVKVIDVWIMLSSLESPGEFHEITISTVPIEGEDINLSDNEVMFVSITDTVRQPRLDGYAESVKQITLTRSMPLLGI